MTATTTTTMRDCWAALIRVAAALNVRDRNVGVLWTVQVPTVSPRAGLPDLQRLADRVGVALVQPGDPGAEGPSTYRLAVDRRPSAYGGGVRPVYAKGKETGHRTPTWWPASAVPRATFVTVCQAVAGALLPPHDTTTPTHKDTDR